MPDAGNPIAGLYPSPPQGQGGGLLARDPLSLVGAITALSANQRAQQEFNARAAVGRAFQGGIGGGNFDPNATLTAISGDPGAALAAPEGVQSALAARGANIANSRNQLQYGGENAQAVANAFAPLAQKANPTMEDAYSAAALATRLGADPKQVQAIISGINPKNIKQQIGNLANYAMGPAAASGRVVGPTGPNGEPTSTSVGAVNAGNPTLQTGLSPVQQADQGEFLADQSKSATTLANIRPLSQALPLVGQLSHLNFGPGSEDVAKVRGILTTLGITNVDPTSEVAVRQEVNKKLLQYARGARDAGRSDSALAAALESNPNLDLTQPANLNLIKNQIGMDRQDAAISQVAGGWSGYKNFKSKYYQNTDPRAFEMDMMSPDEIAKLNSDLKGKDRDKFLRSLNIAQKAGLVTVPGAQ